MDDEILINVALSPLALKLRTLRIQRNLSTKDVSVLTNILEEDIIAFETGKKVPSEEEKQILLNLTILTIFTIPKR